MIKIFRANRVYSGLLSDIYRKHPEAADMDFEKQMNWFYDFCINESRYWKDYLVASGQFQIMEVITNASHLQTRWAQSRKLHTSNPDEILMAQIEEFRPDVIYDNTRSNFTPAVRKQLKKKYPGLKFIAWDGLPVGSIDYFEGTDLLFSYLPYLAAKYEARGIKTAQIPFGFEPGVLSKIPAYTQRYSTTFIGSIEYNIHAKRIQFLKSIQKNYPIDMWVGKLNLKKVLLGMKQLRFKEIISSLGLKAKSHGSLFGLDYYKILQASDITLNIQEHEGAGNIRYVEATGCGTCLLTDWKPDILDYYTPDSEIVTYKTMDEAIDKIKYLLQHETERKKIALAGQQKTFQHFNMKSRALKFGQAINQLVSN